VKKLPEIVAEPARAIAPMFWRLCSIVLLALASLRVNAASLTDVVVTNEAAGSPVVKVAVVHEAPATNPSASDNLGRFTRQSPRKPARENVGTPDTLNNPGILDRSPNRIEEARKEFEEALKIYEAFAKEDPEQFSPHVKRVKKLLKELPR
jgi:hypothetical protein